MLLLCCLLKLYPLCCDPGWASISSDRDCRGDGRPGELTGLPYRAEETSVEKHLKSQDKSLLLNSNLTGGWRIPPLFPPACNLACKSLPGELADFTTLPHVSACCQELKGNQSLPTCLNLWTCVHLPAGNQLQSEDLGGKCGIRYRQHGKRTPGPLLFYFWVYFWRKELLMSATM